jgi:hypothetical protein
MTDESALPDDELVSAYLDGAVDEVERARVESSPELLARADLLGAARDAVAAATPPPDSALRDEHIANALATLGAAAPISLADRRARRTHRQMAVLSAAAAVIAVLGVLAVVSNRNDRASLGSTAGRSSTATSAADSKTDAAAESAAAATTAPGGGAGAGGFDYATTTVAAGATRPAASPTSRAPDLGALDASSAPAALRAASDLRQAAPPECAVPAGTHFVGTATYAGAPVLAYVTEPVAPEARGVLLDPATCTVVEDLPLT